METQCYELYVVQTDILSDQTLDKIVMNETEVENFFENYIEMDEIQITGLFGCQIEIQKSLLSNYGISSLNNSHIGKGKIFGIQYNKMVIICLILQEEYFLKKPIDEKSIQITLVRIFCDLAHNMQLCFSEKIYQNWYEGDYLPFSEINVLKRQEYIIDSTQNKEITQQTLKFQFKRHYGQQQNFYQENMTQYFVKGELKKLSQDEQKDNLLNAIGSVVSKIYQSLQKNEKPQIYSILEQHSIIQEYDRNGDIKKQIPSLESQVKSLIDRSYQKTQSQAKELKEISQKFLNSLKLNIQDSIIFNFQRQVCKIQRKSDSIQNNVSSINFEQEDAAYTQNFYFGTNCFFNLGGRKFWEYDIQLRVQGIFRTKENSELFIFYDESKYQSYLYVLPKNLTKWINIGNIQKSEFCVFYFDQKTNYLFAFNTLNNKQINKFEISDNKILFQSTFCEQIYQKQEIFVYQIAYLSYTKNFIILHNFHKEKCQFQFYALNEETKKFSKICLKNQKNEEQSVLLNVQLLSCPSGKYFYISNFSFCDMYDCNYTIVKTINLSGYLTILSDSIDVFLLNLFDEKKQINLNENALILSNVIELSSLKKVTKQEIILEGNPGLDLLKGSYAKFGPFSNFLSKQKIKHHIFLKEESFYQKVRKYLQQLNLLEFDISIFQNPQFHSENYKTFKGISYSRVPIQLCTIENGNITPLIDGFRKDICLNQKIDISEKAELLRFSYLEKYLTLIKDNIFVVCIIGKQSSGKSYLLNRIFGTRYSVAACRCTDGIWASFAKIEDQNFLILDCEGLFSSVRSQKEEVQLLALLTALSDVTLQNQDLTFNRYFSNLLENLTAASDQLVGDTLFKGVLNIVLRDISASDNSGVDEELIANINKLKSGDNQEVVFVKKLFNGRFYVEKLFNYENKWFDDQIVKFRNQFLQQSKETSRWLNGEQLISSLKILLCQLEMSDKTNSTLLQQQQKINKIFKLQKKVWLKFIQSLWSFDEKHQAEDDIQQLFDDQNDIKVKIFKILKLEIL